MTREEMLAAFPRWLEEFNAEIVKDEDFIKTCTEDGDLATVMAGTIIAYHAACLFKQGMAPVESANEVKRLARKSRQEYDEQRLMSLPIEGTH